MEGDPGGLITAIVKILSDLGLPGLMIGALGWAYWQVTKRNAALNDKLNDTLVEVTKEYAAAVNANTAAINRQSDLLLRAKLPE